MFNKVFNKELQLLEKFTDSYIYTFEGIDNNETIKVYRSGGADPDGDHPGDLYVTIKVKTSISSSF